MTKDQIFTEIQKIVSNNPVVVIDSGASVSEFKQDLWELAVRDIELIKLP